MDKNLRKRIFWDRVMQKIFFACGILSVLLLLGIFILLISNGYKGIFGSDWKEFFLSSTWRPSAFGDSKYGIGSMIISTFIAAFGSMVIAIPLGIGTAAFLSEFAPSRLKDLVKPMIEMLAAVPSVAIGFIGVVWLGPLIARTFDLPNGLNALNGSILLSIMALPTIISVAEDAINSVPEHYKEAAYALGANSWYTLLKITLPACYSGLIAAVMLGIGRAIGETMTVMMATGNAIEIPGSFFDSIRTMTATIAIEMGEVAYGSKHYHTLFAIGAVLFIITFGFNYLAETVASGLRKKGN
jgi:phosphate transport system permease protein